uniref:Uncharacterized protein n=1 Tax=Manihot esculenta TaxID=3983 RepID=A0A2C9WLK5_MANES
MKEFCCKGFFSTFAIYSYFYHMLLHIRHSYFLNQSCTSDI